MLTDACRPGLARPWLLSRQWQHRRSELHAIVTCCLPLHTCLLDTDSVLANVSTGMQTVTSHISMGRRWRLLMHQSPLSDVCSSTAAMKWAALVTMTITMTMKPDTL